MYERHQFIDKRIHVVEFLHDDGVKSSIRIIPCGDGLSLHVALGPEKVLHDLMIQRPEETKQEEIVEE